MPVPAGSAEQQAAPPAAAARLVPLERGLYELRLAAVNGMGSAYGLALPAARIAAAPNGGAAIAVSDAQGRAACWLEGAGDALFVRTTERGAVLVTAYLLPDASPRAVELEIRRLDPPAAPVRLRLGDPPGDGAPAVIDAVAHIHGRGDVPFADAAWIGRLGPEAWLEAFVLEPRDPAVAAAIEYKGLTASGIETPWLGSGALCGTRGQNLPLVGFAVRQKAGAGGTRLDCEYSGAFRSGAVVAPRRNGAPCRSALDGDALEGLQLRIIRRPGG